jgi:hypothetical protein
MKHGNRCAHSITFLSRLVTGEGRRRPACLSDSADTAPPRLLFTSVSIHITPTRARTISWACAQQDLWRKPYTKSCMNRKWIRKQNTKTRSACRWPSARHGQISLTAKECSRAGCMQVAEAVAVCLDRGCLGGGDGNGEGVGCRDRCARWLKQLEPHGGHVRVHYKWQAVYASGHSCPKKSLDLRHMSLAAAM